MAQRLLTPGWRTLEALLIGLVAWAAVRAHASPFDDTVAPILARRCLGCHTGTDPKGGLDLGSSETALTGGDSGPALAKDNPAASLLWSRIAADEMPPKSPLPAKEKEAIRAWLASGAATDWGPIDPFRWSTDERAGRDWWSLAPLEARTPPPPTEEDGAGAESGSAVNPIDAFVRPRLKLEGMRPSPTADRVTLLRRVYFDLVGLPPSPQEAAAFGADPRPDAYGRLVDRLLASPHFGERWARHWLDVVRFGESQGFEYDRIRPNAYLYRDFVIDAFNGDMPYDEFVRRQLAGDVIWPGDPAAVAATGFLTCGPWDEAGQRQQSAAMRAVVRHDELEDLIAVTAQTFFGLTVNCARCHDHKFDPIPQSDYYRLASALGGVRHGERPRPGLESLPSDLQAECHSLAEKIAGLEAELSDIERPARSAPTAAGLLPPPPSPIARWDFDDLDDSIGNLALSARGGAILVGGQLVLNGVDAYVVSAPLSRPLREKTLEAWVTLANLEQSGGGVLSLQTPDGSRFDAIVFGERQRGRWLAGSEFFRRTQDVEGPEETAPPNRLIHLATTYAADGTITLYRDGVCYGQGYAAGSIEEFSTGKAQIVLGLRHSPAAAGKFLAGAIDRAQLYDRALSAEEVALSAGTGAAPIPTAELVARLGTRERRRRAELMNEHSRLRLRRELLGSGPVYASVPSQPEPTQILARGNPAQPLATVAPGGLGAVPGLAGDFGLEPDSPESERRVRLAAWITDAKNPLTARVIVNRLWHYHFGVGLVDTPNDFGFHGGRPSHPELLDWLADELIRSGWRLKHLHRLIVTSQTYRQSSTDVPACSERDPGNRLLWRKSPTRLDAETLRDAMLSVAGELNPTMGGPGFHDFQIKFHGGNPAYETIDQAGEPFQRRTIYRTWVRGGTNRFLDVFDCPDPSTTTPRRIVTTTPLQALSHWNSAFVLRVGDRFAERLEREAGPERAAQVDLAYRLCFSRSPTAEEEGLVARFADAHGLASLCRVLLNSSEFIHVD